MKRLTGSMMLAAAGMSTAVALLMLFAANVLKSPVLSAICLFIASVMTWVPLREDSGYVFAGASFMLTSVIALLICGGPFTYLYIMLFGHYGIAYLFARQHIEDDLLRWLVMLLYANLFIAGGLAIASYLFYYDVRTLAPELPVWAIILIMEVGLVIFGVLYHFCCDLFDTHARKVLLPRR